MIPTLNSFAAARWARRFLALAPVSLLWATSLTAATTTVDNLTAFQAALNAANPGDTVVLKNGTYVTGASGNPTIITLNRQGTAAAPIVARAETIGGATLSGSGAIRFAAPAAHCRIEGFVLTHAQSINIPGGTSFCRLSRNIIQLSIPAGSDVSYVNIQGDDAQIDRNELRNKSTLGNMLDITGAGGSQVARRLWVHHNYFHDFTGAGGNGAETIRWGLSSLSLSTGDGLCEYNLFVRCNGENEMISNKSSGNVYRYNTVIDGREISQRHGDNCQYYGNYMINSDGMRIYGDNHLFHSNYIEGNSNGIVIGNGDGDVHAGAPLTSHDRPDNCVIVFNTLINNTTGYAMGGRTNGLGATGTVFANNIIQGGTTAVNISGTAPYATPTWSGNIIFGATSVGNIPASGYANVDPRLVLDADGVFHLGAGSPAIDTATGSYAAVAADQDGQPRSGAKDKGADEVSGSPEVAFKLTTADVGPQSGLEVPAVAPSFSPAGGTYTGAQSVAISTTSSGASIRYTTDGSTPTATTGTLYSAPVSVATNTTVKAVAFGPGFITSPVSTATYAIRAGAPSFSPPPGTFSAAQSVALSSATSGASIRYTTDGSNPSSTAGTLYTGPISIESTTVLNAIAFKSGLTDSVISSGTYTINDGSTVVAPADGFVNTPFTSQTGTFTATFDATPSLSPANINIGLCQGAQTAYTGLAAAVRFNTTGTIDARNGGAFTTGTVAFSANVKYRFRLVVNVATRTYSAFVTPAGGTEQTLGTNLAFRTEQAGVTRLDTATVAVNATPGGSVRVSPFAVVSTTTITSADGFVNRPFANQTGTFTATFDASVSVSPSNTNVGLTSGAQSAYTGLAAAIRFNTAGTIDARNGGAFTTSSIAYTAGTMYRFRLVVNVGTRTYSAFVTAPGGAEQTIGTNLAFRTEQASVTSLSNATYNVNATPGGSLTFTPVTIAP